MAKAQQPQKVGFRERVRQIGTVISFTAKRDKLFIPLASVAAGVPIALGILAGVAGWGGMWVVLGVMLALLAALVVLNVRSNSAMMAAAADQPGAAASIIESFRGDWRVTPAMASTTQYDMVHLVIGRPGVILLGEGNPARVRSLLNQERRRLAKVIGSADLRDYLIGDEEGAVPLRKLRTTLTKLPRTLSGSEVNSLDKRLTALTARPQMPKGAIPKNMRPAKGTFKATRGR